MRYIDLLVDNEHIKGSGVTIGAAGSHDAVALRLTFSEAWDGLTKRVLWIDARGTTRTETVLTTPLAETENVYAVPVPASPLQYPGKMSVTLYGVELDGGDEVLKIVTEAAFFPIMSSFYDPESDPDGPLDIDPTIADQLQAEIDDILDDILDARAAAQDSEAWAVGQIDGVDVDSDDPRYHNNSKYYAQQAQGSVSDAEAFALAASGSASDAADRATAAAGSATSAAGSYSSAAASAVLSESWAVGGTGTRTGEDTNNSEYWAAVAMEQADRASVPPVEGVYNVVVTDRITGDKYAVVAVNGRLTLLACSADTDTANLQLVDVDTGITYSLIAESGRLVLEEV